MRRFVLNIKGINVIKLASWNVNSLNVRLPQVMQWLKDTNIDILAIQETKLVDEVFPQQPLQELGFNAVFSGQKTYNGVAILSRMPIADVVTDIETFIDPQRRILAATIGGIRVINLYVPNGSEVGSDKYLYKLQWLQQIQTFIKQQLAYHKKLAVVGDFNIAPQAEDVYDPIAVEGSVLFSLPEREHFASLLGLGLEDSFRYLYPQEPGYTWWDYRAASFRRNRGWRIDHILLSASLMKQCVACHIDVEARRAPRPSDHAPIWVELIEQDTLD